MPPLTLTELIDKLFALRDSDPALGKIEVFLSNLSSTHVMDLRAIEVEDCGGIGVYLYGKPL